MSTKKKNTSALSENDGIEQPNSLSAAAATKIKEARKRKQAIPTLINQITSGNITALSRGITIIESTTAKDEVKAKQIIEGCLPYANKSLRIGITGVPGVGKSTIIYR